MPVRREHGGQLARFPFGPIQAAGDVKARIAFEKHLLDRVAVAIDFAVDHGIGRRLRRHRPQARRHQHLPPHILGPLLPRLGIRTHRERKIPIQILQRPQPRIIRQFARRQYCAGHPQERWLAPDLLTGQTPRELIASARSNGSMYSWIYRLLVNRPAHFEFQQRCIVWIRFSPTSFLESELFVETNGGIVARCHHQYDDVNSAAVRPLDDSSDE